MSWAWIARPEMDHRSCGETATRRHRHVPARCAIAATERRMEEVRALKERLQVLERITVEKENTLSREIDSLRDR